MVFPCASQVMHFTCTTRSDGTKVVEQTNDSKLIGPPDFAWFKNSFGVDMTRLFLPSGTRIVGFNFTDTNLSRGVFRGITFVGCDFTRADVSNVDFTCATFSACKFLGTVLTQTNVQHALFDSGCTISLGPWTVCKTVDQYVQELTRRGAINVPDCRVLAVFPGSLLGAV